MIVRNLPSALLNWIQFHQEIVTIGVGTLCESLLRIGDSYQESEHALRYHQKGQELSIICFENIGINRLFGKHTINEIQLFVNQVLKPIIEIDDPTLLETITCYIEQSRSISKTAKLLHIHQNTLYHRLKKIEQLIDRQLDCSEHFLEISLAVHLHATNGH